MAETIAVAYKPSFLTQHRRIITIAAMVGCAGLFSNLVLGFPIALSLVLIVQTVMFLMLFERPVWAIASILLGQLTISNYMFYLGGMGISVRFVWTIMAILILIPVLRKKGGIRLGPGAGRIIIPAVIFFGWSIMATIINTGLSQNIDYLRTSATSILLITLIPAAIKDESDLKLLGLVAIVTSVISALFAMAQYYNYSGLPIPAYAIVDNAIQNGRVSGLSESPVVLGFSLPMVIMPALSILLLNGVNSRNKKILIVLSIIMAWGLYYSFTRSGFYSLIPGILLVLILMKGKYKKQIFLIILAVTVLSMFIIDKTGNRYSQGFSSDTSAAGRLVLWQGGLMVARDNLLFGIGQGRFAQVSAEYTDQLSPALMENLRAAAQRNVQGLGFYEAHNDFITVCVAYGLVALVAYLWVLANTLRNFLQSYRRLSSPFLKALALGCFGAIISYIVNAFTHNVMDSSQLLWIFGGLSIAAIKLTTPGRTAGLKESHEKP